MDRDDEQGPHIGEDIRVKAVEVEAVRHGYPRKTQLFQRQQVVFALTEKERAIFTALEVLDIEDLKGLAGETLVAVPEIVLRPVGKNTAGGIAVAVGLKIGIDDIAAVKADLQFGQDRGRHPGSRKVIAQGIGQAVMISLDLGVDIDDRIVDALQGVLPLRVKPRRLSRIDCGQTGEPERKSAGHATVEASEIAVERSVLIEIDHQFSGRFMASVPTERAVRHQGGLFPPSCRQMPQIEFCRRVPGRSHDYSLFFRRCWTARGVIS